MYNYYSETIVAKQRRRAEMTVEERRERRRKLRQLGGMLPFVVKRFACQLGHENCRTEILSNGTHRHVMFFSMDRKQS
jgi:hypothetical protein